MRRHPTDAEALLWSELRRSELGVRFRRQHPIGRFIVDFVCLRYRLIVEVDGSQHGGDHDRAREEFLRSTGFTVLRLWSWEVISDLEGSVEEIAAALGRLGWVPPTSSAPPR
jgi:very-short-patch-repair endonuclease